MGRIAEALKKAQHERARRLERHSPACVEPGAETAGGDPEAVPPDGGTLVADVPARVPLQVNASPVPPDQVGPHVVMLHDPAGAVAEKYRSLRTRLLSSNPAGSPRVLAITSSLPREGKTVTVANLAFSLAELRQVRVAIVDLDFRKPALCGVFGISDRPGVAEMVRGERPLADCCIPLVRSNLHLIPAGDAQGCSPSDLLVGERVPGVFKEIADRFHYVLIDTPPMNTVADIGLIAPLCHGVLVVIRMNRTPEPVLRRCVKLMQANRVPIVGSILAGYSDQTLGYTDTYDYYQSPQ
jgi:capsular exopolysaccharide synthesis family protein